MGWWDGMGRDRGRGYPLAPELNPFETQSGIHNKFYTKLETTLESMYSPFWEPIFAITY